MSAVAIGLILFSAVLHASWNMLAKRSADPLAFIFAFNVISIVVYAIPTAIVLASHPIPASGWQFMAASGSVHVVYMLTLAAAYRHGALSMAYPIVRGTGVLLVPILAVPILNEIPTVAGAVGIGAILCGLLAMAVPGRAGTPTEITSEQRKGMLFAFISGLTIASYSLIDKHGVDHVHPMVYVYGIFLVLTLGMAPVALSQKRVELRHEWRTNRLAVLVGGVLPLGAYLVVLFAMRIAAVSYVVPLRETSIIVSTVLGAVVLKERIGPLRIVASVFIACGVLAIALGG